MIEVRRRKNHNQTGFTLVEMIVSVAVFSVVMLISIGALLSVTGANRKAQSVKSVINNLNFAVESMTRSMRVGTTYHCTTSGDIAEPMDCTSGASYIAFEEHDGDVNNSGDQTVYRLSGTQIERSSNSGASFIPITATEVVVEDLDFYVRDTSTTDNDQPNVLIVVRGYAGKDQKSRTYFNLQTFISQRRPDRE